MAVRLRRMLFAGVIFWSALLLLVLQPVLTKAILPWFGGSAGVWTTSMLFFQALLLLGYLYAHLLNRRLTMRHQVILHGGLLLIAALTLPVVPAGNWKPQAGVDPSAAILGLLAVSAGLPYFLLSTTSPLLQAWYSRVFRDELPYRLYAVSNFGSLVALLSYPFLIEPYFPVSFQLGLWSAGFVAFALACAVAGAFCLREGIQEPQRSERPQFADVATWFALAMVPSVLWLAVGNQLSQDVAAVPFLWILPLAVYLVTFVLCFDHDRWYRPRVFR